MPRSVSSTGLRAGFDNLSAVVEAAGSANVVRQLELAADLGVPVLARHTALGDAVTVALAWLALRAR